MIEGMQGDGSAYRKLGLLFLGKKGQRPDVKLAKLCLMKAIEMEDEESFFIYHRIFSQGRQVIDDRCYLQMYREYRQAVGRKEKKRLKRYLLLGTGEQRRMCMRGRLGGREDGRDCDY